MADIAEINTDTVVIPDIVDAPPSTAPPVAPPKNKDGRPPGSKNKKPADIPVPEDPPPKQPPKPVESPPDSDPTRRRPAKRKSRTRVIVLSSSESEDAPPPVRVVRKPRATPHPVADDSTDEEPPPTPRCILPRQSRQPRRFEPDVRAQHQQHLDARRATYDGYFRHLH